VALGVEKQRLLARVEHLDRATGNLGEQGGVNLPGDVLFAAEAAADQRAAHANLVFGQAEGGGRLAAILVGNLRADVEGQLGVPGVVTGRYGNGALRLHEGVLDRRRAVLALDDHIGLGEALLDVTMTHLDMLEQVARLPFLVDERRFRRVGRLRVADDGQRLVVHFDQFQGAGGGVGVVRSDDSHRVAHIAHLVGAQHRPVGVHQAVNVLAGHVFVGQHGAHAGQRFGPAGIKARDARVGVGGAQRAPDQHARENVIIGEPGPPDHLVHNLLRRDGPAHRIERGDRRARLPGDRPLAAQFAGR